MTDGAGSPSRSGMGQLRRAVSFLAVVLCTACVDTDCEDAFITDTAYTLRTIGSGNDFIATSWFVGSRGLPPQPDLPMYATTIFASGDLGPVVELPTRLGGAVVTGSVSVLWHASLDLQCVTHEADAPPLQVALVRDGVVRLIDVSAEGPSNHSIVFAQGAYQVFWLDANMRLRHRAVSEDGALGPVHDLGPQSGYCIHAVSDLEAVHLVIARTFPVESPIMLVDTTTGSMQPAWTVASRAPLRALWFAGELHVLSDGPQIQSINPTTGLTQMRTPDPGLPNLFAMAVGSDALFVPLYSSSLNERQIVELDVNFTIIERHTMSPTDFFDSQIASIGSDFVFGEKVNPNTGDGDGPEPERIDIIRQAKTGIETWRTTAVSDPVPRPTKICPIRD